MKLEFEPPDSPTPEGTQVRYERQDDRTIVIEEVGKGDQVVYRYHFVNFELEEGMWVWGVRHDVGDLIARLDHLQQAYERLKGQRPMRLEFSIAKQNRKAAAARLRRLRRELGFDEVAVSEEQERLVHAALHDDDEPFVPDDDLLFKKLWEENEIHLYRDYLTRRMGRPVLVLTNSSIPPRFRDLLDEAREAYCHGLFRCAVAVCRVIVEAMFKRILSQRKNDLAAPITGDNLANLISCLKPLLKPKAVEHAEHVRQHANTILHKAASAGEGEAWWTLAVTSALVQYLANSGFLEETDS